MPFSVMARITIGFICILSYLHCVSLISLQFERQLRETQQIENNNVTTNLTNTTTTIPDPCICSKVYDPVCASNDKSYYNICQFKCANKDGNVTVVYQGYCIPF